MIRWLSGLIRFRRMARQRTLADAPYDGRFITVHAHSAAPRSALS